MADDLREQIKASILADDERQLAGKPTPAEDAARERFVDYIAGHLATLAVAMPEHLDLVPVERLCVGDVVRFGPSSSSVDVVERLHLRRHIGEPVERSHAVTVTHAGGCWTKDCGELVEVFGTVLDG